MLNFTAPYTAPRAARVFRSWPGSVTQAFDHPSGPEGSWLFLLRCSRKVKRAGHERRPIDQHDLVVGDGVLGVNVGGNVRMG